MLKAGHVALKTENKLLKKEDEKLYDMCKDMSRDLTNLNNEMRDIKGSYTGFHHSRCVVVSNLSLINDEDPKHTFQSFINNKLRMVGINVARTKQLSRKHSLFLAELDTQCRAVLKKTSILRTMNAKVYVNPVKSDEALKMEHNLKTIMDLVPGARHKLKFLGNGRLELRTIKSNRAFENESKTHKTPLLQTPKQQHHLQPRLKDRQFHNQPVQPPTNQHNQPVQPPVSQPPTYNAQSSKSNLTNLRHSTDPCSTHYFKHHATTTS